MLLRPYFGASFFLLLSEFAPLERHLRGGTSVQVSPCFGHNVCTSFSSDRAGDGVYGLQQSWIG